MPNHDGGYLVRGSVTAANVTQEGPRTEWKVASDNDQLACVEFRANTGACETLVRIKGRAAAQEKYPIKDAGTPPK